MTTGYGTPGMDLGVGEDGRCLSSQAALPPSGLSRQKASQAKPAAANAALLALADRCEAAIGPDREMDVDVHIAVTTFEPRRAGPGWRDENALVVPVFPGWAPLPLYTASIDAAMMLVPEGWHWSLYDTNGSAIEPLAVAQLEPEQFSSEPITGEATTPPLALTAAALRARAASVDTLPKGGDGEAGSVRSKGSAVPKADAQTSEVNND